MVNLFPLDDVAKEVLKLYSLVVPCEVFMRESQHDAESMAGRMRPLVALRLASTLNPDKPLKVQSMKGYSETCSGQLSIVVPYST